MAFQAERNDTQAFTEGTWKDLLGGQFRIARAGNIGYTKALEASGYRKMEDSEDQHYAFLKALSQGILKDWNDVLDEKGEQIPYSTENAVKVLDDNPELVNAILEEARNMSNFRRQDMEDQAKKPASSSGSRQSGAKGET